MKYKIETLPNFEREAKPLLKKYPSLKEELAQLLEKLTVSPNTGVPLGKNCYKIRLAVASKGKGKSGSARIITYLLVSQTTVFLLSIYDKSEHESVSTQQLVTWIKSVK